MSWVKLDDGFHINPKIRRAWKGCRASVGLYTMGLAYSAQLSTDGHLDDIWVAEQLPARDRNRASTVLIECGLWTPTDSGYAIHDFLDYNDSAADLALRRARDADRKAVVRRNGGRVPEKSERTQNPVRADFSPRARASRPDPTHISPPNPPEGGKEQISSEPPKRPTSGRKRDLEAFDDEMAAWASHHFSGANTAQVKALVAWMRSRSQTVTAETLREYASKDPVWQPIVQEAAR